MKNFHLKIVIFTAVKNYCMLHERVFIMRISNTLLSIMYLYPKVCQLTSLSEKIRKHYGWL